MTSGRRSRNRAILSAFDAQGHEIFEQVLDLAAYREDTPTVIDDDMYRKRHGVRRLVGMLFGPHGELVEEFEHLYDAAGDLETSRVRHADGSETTTP